nr:hypothetical protein Iba_chr05fCG13850 [Ipomoea batatas]
MQESVLNPKPTETDAAISLGIVAAAPPESNHSRMNFRRRRIWIWRPTPSMRRPAGTSEEIGSEDDLFLPLSVDITKARRRIHVAAAGIDNACAGGAQSDDARLASKPAAPSANSNSDGIAPLASFRSPNYERDTYRAFANENTELKLRLSSHGTTRLSCVMCRCATKTPAFFTHDFLASCFSFAFMNIFYAFMIRSHYNLGMQQHIPYNQLLFILFGTELDSLRARNNRRLLQNKGLRRYQLSGQSSSTRILRALVPGSLTSVARWLHSHDGLCTAILPYLPMINGNMRFV